MEMQHQDTLTYSSFQPFTDSIKAREQWTITLSTRGTMVGKLLKMAGLSNLEEASKPYRISLDNRDVEE